MSNSAIPTKRQGFLSALSYPNYRHLWISTLGTTASMSMEMVVFPWIILEITNSPFLVGLVAACRYIGMGLGPFLGALADRFDRRRLLMIARASNSGFSLILVILYYTSLLEVWHIFVLALGTGLFLAIDFTTRFALAADTVENHNLTSAAALLFAGLGLTAIFGPLAGGYLLKSTGAGGCFIAIGSCYLFSSLMLSPLRLKIRDRLTPHEPVRQSVLSGIHYVINDKPLLAVIILAAIANLFAFPCMFSIMPVLARNVLDIGSEGLGWLISAEGAGSLIGSLIISSLGRVHHKGRLAILGMLAWPTLLLIFGILSSFHVGLGLLVGVGMFRGFTMSIIQIICLMRATEENRGRVSGIRMFAIVFLPIGNILSGAGIGLWGAPNMIIINAVACIATTLIAVMLVPQIHQQA